MTETDRCCHRHTPELREQQHYGNAIPADAWVCAECETFLGWVTTP